MKFDVENQINQILLKNISIFDQLLFDFEAQTINSLSKTSLIKVVWKIWSPLQNIPGILIKIYNVIKPFLVSSLQSVPVLCITKWCTNSET